MKTINISRPLMGALGLLLSTSALLMPVTPVLAGEAQCPYCTLPIVQDTAQLDNAVKMRTGGRLIQYRCVFCAIAEAKSEYPQGNVMISSPSEKKGAPVILKRTGGKWTAAPNQPFFVGARVKHKFCQAGYRAFRTRQAAQTYIAKNKDLVGNAKPLTLSQMVALSK